MIEKLIKELASTSKKLEKEKILAGYESDFIKDVALYTFDTIKKQYHIKKYNKCELEGNRTIEQHWNEIKELLTKLSERTLSGNKAIYEVEKMRLLLAKDSQLVFDLIIGRDWKAGLSASTINKVWPKTIPEFNTALAVTYDPTKHQKLLDEHTHFISRKLDGVRCIAINVNGEWKFRSREGKPFLTLGKVAEDLNKWNIKNVVLDGELCMVDEDGNESYKAIMKVIKKKNFTIPTPKFKVFDYLKLSEFREKKSKSVLRDRLGNLKVELSTLKLDTIDILEQVKFTEEAFTGLLQSVKTLGWEGLMLRRNTTYNGKRCNDLLKVKDFYDDEYEVVGVELADMTFTTAGVGVEEYYCVKNVKIEHKGHIVSVGSGLSKEERIYYTDRQDEIIGKIITVAYFEETKNEKGGISLRFPTLKVIHGNERDT